MCLSCSWAVSREISSTASARCSVWTSVLGPAGCQLRLWESPALPWLPASPHFPLGQLSLIPNAIPSHMSLFPKPVAPGSPQLRVGSPQGQVGWPRE